MRRASGLLDTHNAVGLQVCGFPDHSVVCHAYRQAGGEQQSFIGGGALAIEVNAQQFILSGNLQRRLVLPARRRKESLQPTAVTGQVIQYPYDPFRNPGRARAEELGDVLAEGIYWLLDQGQSIADADEAYWTGFLVKRRRFIEGVLDMVKEDGAIELHEQARRIAALKGSLGRLTLITPILCESYLRVWADDRQRWLDHVDQLPSGRELPEPWPRCLGGAARRWNGGLAGRSVDRSGPRRIHRSAGSPGHRAGWPLRWGSEGTAISHAGSCVDR